MNAPSVADALQGVIGAAVLLTVFAMLRSLLVESVVRIYAIQSLLVAAFTAVAAWRGSNPTLYVLAGLTLAIKVIVIPIVVNAILRRLGGEDRIPLSVPVPRSFLIGIVLSALAFALVLGVGIQASAAGGFGVGTAVFLVGLFMISARHNAIVQLMAFLALDNGVFLASVALAPGLSAIVAVLLVLDILIPAGAFVLVIRVVAARRNSLHTVELTNLRG